LREKLSVINDASYYVESLTFKDVTFSDKKTAKLAEAIKNAKDVKELNFHRCKLRTEQHILLYKALE
jgi:type VI protein secretion system component Hcp